MSDISSGSVGVKFHVRAAGPGQCFIVAAPHGPCHSDAAAADIYAAIGRTLAGSRLRIIQERVFGSMGSRGEVLTTRAAALVAFGISPDGPLTYIEGNPVWGQGLAGVIIRAISAETSVTPILHGNATCGWKWSADGAEYIILQNMHSQSVSNPPDAQARDMIEQAENMLRTAGMSFRNVQRTWFYLRDILDWYGPFNKARNELYTRLGVMPGPGDTSRWLPASTGISGANPMASACAMDILAMNAGPGSRVSSGRLLNPVQNEAPTYGSAFSRAVVVRQPDCSLIEVSGTAAIDTAGKSLYPDDIDAQIVCTIDKIEALIAQEKAGLADICAASVFVKKPQFAARFWGLAAERGLSDFPCVCVVADVCRDELLFEIDAEAVVNRK